MAGHALADCRGSHLIDGAGHWVQQEQADTVSRLLLDFVRSAAAA
jgi:pimeloyl-ACP methyl ester carboxylesterase